jgi:hypothetical protein
MRQRQKKRERMKETFQARAREAKRGHYIMRVNRWKWEKEQISRKGCEEREKKFFFVSKRRTMNFPKMFISLR